jgi:ATP-binding cassette subfamily B protein/subfamily B ATP-binding cassette protein MsbA
MVSFLRSVQLSLRRRWTFVGAVLCALAVGILWGGNIGTVFPFVEVVFRGQSLPQWVDREIQRAEARLAEVDGQLNELTRTVHANRPVNGHSDRRWQRLHSQRDAEIGALSRFRRVQPWVHHYLPAEPYPTLVLIVGIVFAGTFLKTVFLAASTVLTERLTQTGTIQLRKKCFHHILHLPLQHLQRDDSSQLMSRLTYDLEQVTVALRTLFGRSMREPLKMLACLVGAACVCWRLLVFSLILAPLAAWAISQLNRSVKRANVRALEQMSQIYTVLGDSLRGIKLVKAFTLERVVRRKFDAAGRQFFQGSMRVAMFDALIRPSVELLAMGVICVALLAGGYLVLNEQTHLLGMRISHRPLSISTLLLFFGLLAGINDPARKLSGVIGRLQCGAAAAERVYQMLDQSSQLPRMANPRPLPLLRQFIQFHDVHFAYGDGPPVLCGIDLTISAGETVAIVGVNGSGKSTLANLIPRFFDPTHGRVEVDGHDLRHVRKSDLRRQIGLVTQDTVLFNDTVLANLQFGNPGATREQIEQIARRAQAHDFIVNELVDGYETVVGEGASRLSGGQKQRLALARAMLRDPRILILDEATSQVDLSSEQQIHEILRDFIRQRATIIITHRLGILTLADRILVMQRGRIVESGTYPELLGRSGPFRQLMQADLQRSA